MVCSYICLCAPSLTLPFQYTIDLPYTTHFKRLRLLMYTFRAVFHCIPLYIDVYTTVGSQPLGIYPTWVERRTEGRPFE
jgi:hypothetical protein